MLFGYRLHNDNNYYDPLGVVISFASVLRGACGSDISFFIRRQGFRRSFSHNF